MANRESERNGLRAALRELPLEVLLKQQREGAKEFNRLYFGTGREGEGQEAGGGSEGSGDEGEVGTGGNGAAAGEADQLKKHHKGRPREVSAKQKPKPRIQIFEVKKPRAVDPRFEATAGDLDMNRFLNCYRFLKDMKQEEVETGEKTLKKRSKIRKLTPEQKVQLRSTVSQNKQELRFIERLDKEAQVKQAIKADMKASGVATPFIRKSELIRGAE